MRTIKFETSNNQISMEDPFVIEIMYNILEDELDESESLVFKSEIEFKKEELYSIRRQTVNIMAGLEQIIRMLGGDVGLRHCLEEYPFFEGPLTDYLTHLLVVFYGSDKEELKINCLKLYIIFNNLYDGLNRIQVDESETFKFINNTCIVEYYK